MRVQVFCGPINLSNSPARVGMMGRGVGFRVEPWSAASALYANGISGFKSSRPGAYPIIARVTFGGTQPNEPTETVDIPIASRRSFYFERAFSQVELLTEFLYNNSGPVQENAFWLATLFESHTDRLVDGPIEKMTISGPTARTVPTAAPPVNDILWQPGGSGIVDNDVIEIYANCDSVTYHLRNAVASDQDVEVYACDNNVGFNLVETLTVPASKSLVASREITHATGIYLKNVTGAGAISGSYTLTVRT